MWGAECDDEKQLAEAAIAKKPLTASSHCHIPKQVGCIDASISCTYLIYLFSSPQDIVVPPTCYEPHPTKDFTHKFKTPYIHKELHGLNRSSLLFYRYVLRMRLIG